MLSRDRLDMYDDHSLVTRHEFFLKDPRCRQGFKPSNVGRGTQEVAVESYGWLVQMMSKRRSQC